MTISDLKDQTRDLQEAVDDIWPALQVSPPSWIVIVHRGTDLYAMRLLLARDRLRVECMLDQPNRDFFQFQREAGGNREQY